MGTTGIKNWESIGMSDMKSNDIPGDPQPEDGTTLCYFVTVGCTILHGLKSNPKITHKTSVFTVSEVRIGIPVLFGHLYILTQEKTYQITEHVETDLGILEAGRIGRSSI